MSTTPHTWTLRHRGEDLAVETWVDDERPRNRARLLVDGEEVDAGAAEEIGSVVLGSEGPHPTRVSWWWTGRVQGAALVEPGTGPGLGDERRRRTPYAPPPGSRAARLHAWGERHPRLWAARHVAVHVLGTVAGILGVSALLGALLGRLLPALDLPDLPDLPDIPWPAWLTYLDPGRYLGPLVQRVADLVAGVVEALFGWLPDGPWVKVVIGLLVAVAIGVQEVRRRRRHEEENARADREREA